MRKVDLITGGTQIRTAWQSLEQNWQQANEQWNDVVSQRFHEEQLETLLPEIKMALDAVSKMQMLLEEAQRDCES